MRNWQHFTLLGLLGLVMGGCPGSQTGTQVRPPPKIVFRIDKRAIRRVAVYNRSALANNRPLQQALARRYQVTARASNLKIKQLLDDAARRGADVALLVRSPGMLSKRAKPDGTIKIYGPAYYVKIGGSMFRKSDVIGERGTPTFTGTLIQGTVYQVFDVRRRLMVEVRRIRAQAKYRGDTRKPIPTRVAAARAKRQLPLNLMRRVAAAVMRGRYFSFSPQSPSARRSLCLAARAGNLPLVKQLLDLGVNASAKVSDFHDYGSMSFSSSQTPLDNALGAGREAVARYLVKRGARLQPNHLLSAFKGGREALLRLVLKLGMHPNHGFGTPRRKANSAFYEICGWVARMHAIHKAPVRARNFRLLRLLLQWKPKLNAAGAFGRTALYFAVNHGDVELARLLLQHGAHPKRGFGSAFHKSAIYQAILKGIIPLVNLLTKHGATINWRGREGQLALETCCKVNSPRVFRFVLSRGASAAGLVHKVLGRGFFFQREKCFITLVRSGIVHPNKPIKGRLPLHIYARKGKLKVVKVLLEHKANPNAVNRYGYTPLHQVAGKNSQKLVQVLLKHKANPNGVDRYGNTPLHKAAYYGAVRDIQLLIQGGAAVNQRNKLGQTPLHVSLRDWLSAKRAVGALIKAGAQVNARYKGKTPLALVDEKLRRKNHAGYRTARRLIIAAGGKK